MNPSSPAKRRALAPLDANVNAMSPSRKLHNKTTTPGSPLKSPIKSPLGLKRPLSTVIFDETSVVANKKQCQEPVAAPAPTPAPASVSIPKPVHVPAAPAAAPTLATAPAQTEEEPDAKERQSEEPQQQDEERQPEMEIHERQASRNRSASPDTSSVFDNSAMDTSQNTTILTEPDLEHVRTLPPPRPRRVMTREEARQKARILRLKLGLANYKLQTGQEDVPLEKLQMKPLPGRETQQRALPRVTIQPPSSRDGPPETESEAVDGETGQSDAEPREQDQGQEPAEKTALPSVPEVETCDDEDSTNCGGAVSSLLSLARASSSVATS